MTTQKQKNTRTAIIVFAVVFGMLGLSFAAVPLYRLFCQVTGFGGTTMVADSAPDESEILDRRVTIRFNTDTGRHMLWHFKPEERSLTTHIGQQAIMAFTATNRDRVPVTGVAVYNVTPPKAGKYFRKLQCFCFGEQTLNPGESATYPVVFYIDPAMDADPNMADVRTITLSYTFFPSGSAALDAAMEAYYEQSSTLGTVALPPKTQ
jgi:cytochrome c oxidase assembly protein subunit 11